MVALSQSEQEKLKAIAKSDGLNYELITFSEDSKGNFTVLHDGDDTGYTYFPASKTFISSE